MNEINAADSHVIKMQPDSWRLFWMNGEDEPRVLLETDKKGLRYGANFGNTRRLPVTGSLETQYIERIIVGWSAEDESWHLGLMLGPELARQRQSRWCELVHWPDPERDVFEEQARYAGNMLAHILNLPFVVVPPREKNVQAPPPPPLPGLPLSFGQWQVARNNAGMLSFQRTARWALSGYLNLLWYLMWAAIYLIVSAATFTSDLALPNAGTLLPNPKILPLAGFAISGLLVINVIYKFIVLRREADRITVDSQTKLIVFWRGRRKLRDIMGTAVQSVYATEVIRKKDKQYVTYHGEISVHVGDGRFLFILDQGGEESNPNARLTDAPRPVDDEVIPLTTHNVNTDLQVASLHLAEALNTPSAWYDVRLK